MGEGSSHKVAVAAWGRWSCCDSMVVVLSGTPGGRAAHKHPCEHPRHPLAEQHRNLSPLVCLGGKRGTSETVSIRWGRDLEERGPGLSRREMELGPTEDRGTKLRPHLQSCLAFNPPVTPQYVPVPI